MKSVPKHSSFDVRIVNESKVQLAASVFEQFVNLSGVDMAIVFISIVDI